MADPISIISRSVQDGCDTLLSDWMRELSKALNPEENVKNKYYHDWMQSHPISSRELGLQTTIFKKILDDDDTVTDDKYKLWRSSFENTNTLQLIDHLWEVFANSAHSSKPLADSSDGMCMRLDAHFDSFRPRDMPLGRVAPGFSPILASSYDEATLSIILPHKMTGRLARLSHVWAIATLKVFLFPNLLHQVDNREKRLKKVFLQRLGYENEMFPYEVLLRAMHIAPDVLNSGQTKTLRDAIFSEGGNIVFILALLISSVPHSFIIHLQILKVLPAPQPILAQSLTDVLQTMISKSATIRAQRNGDARQLFIDWLNKVFARETLHSLVQKVRLLVECCWTSGLHKRLLELSAGSLEKDVNCMETECLQVLLLLRLQNSFLAFRKLMAPMPGSTSALIALDTVCSSLQLLTDFHFFSRAAHDRLKNRHRVRESIALSDSLYAFSLPYIYPFYFENLRLPGSSLPIPILISHDAVVSIGNTETVFFSESVRAEDHSLVLKPILISPCDTTHNPDTQTCIESNVLRLPTHDSKVVINWGALTSDNDPSMKAQKFNYWFIAVQCARVALWMFENPRGTGEALGTGTKAAPKISCAYRWFPKRAVQYIESFVALCTQANDLIRENAADVLRARGFNMSDISLETTPVLSACVANVIAGSANLLNCYNHFGSHSHRSSRHFSKTQLKIDNSAHLQDYVSGFCSQCHALIQTSINQVEALIKLPSVSCIAFQRYSLLFEDITLSDLQSYDLRDLDSNEAEAERLDLMIRVCAADNMFLRLFDVFDHHSPMIQSNLLRLPGAGGIPFLNFPELRLRRLCERVHVGKLIKILSKQLKQSGPLLEKFTASHDKIQVAGSFGKDKAYIIDHLLKPRSDMGGNCVVGKLHDGVAGEQLIAVANSIWDQICFPEYSKLLDQLISAQYPIEFGIRLRLLVEPLCNILQSSSNKEFGADDIIPLTEFVFNFVFAPRAMPSLDAYLHWIAKLCTFKEMLNDELAQSYLHQAEGLVHSHTENSCPHQNWQGDIPAVKKFVQQLLTERETLSECGPITHSSHFAFSSSDDDVESDAGMDNFAAADDSLSASELAALAASPRVRSVHLVEDTSGTEKNVQFSELTRSCIKRNSLLQMLHQANIVKNHMYLYKSVQDCLRASEAIDWMMHIKVCDSRADAIRIGKLMVADGLISPVDHNNAFADKALLFQCVKPVVFESSLTITWGFFDRHRHFAIYPKSSDGFTLCWFKDKHKTEVRGEICIFPSSVIKPVNEMDLELSLIQETKKGYGWIKENKCFSVRAENKQLRDRWLDELTQAQKRLSVAVPELEPRVGDEKPRPSFFVPSSLSESQRDSTQILGTPSFIADLALSSSAVSSGDALGSSVSPIIFERQPAVIELDHVFYRGAHMSFNDFLLTASSESEWYIIQFFSLCMGKWH